MPGTRRMILKHVMSGICSKMNRTKLLPTDVMETPLNRCLTTLDITLLGVGHMVGAGIYVLTGTVAKETAGPAIILSFILSAFVSILAALCYAEFGTRVPKAGSAYVYAYVSIGEFWAFVIGWNILLEHMLGAAMIARAWSGYVDSMLDGYIANTTISFTGELHEQMLAKHPDFLAFFVCIGYAAALGTGVKATAVLNGILTMINITVITMVIALGFWFANSKNWTDVEGGFFPFGFGGVIAGAASCFYAFIGFDSIATCSEEARNPTVSIPLATMLSLLLVTIAYVLVSAALTLMIPYYDINPSAALSDAFGSLGLPWAKYAISAGALCGMTTSLLGSLFGLPRCLYSMASDGLIFSCFGKVNARTQVPILNLVIAGISSALLALLFDLEKLVEFMSIGTLLAFTIVSASVIILRYRPSTVDKPITLESPDDDDEDGTSRSSIASISATSDVIEIALTGRLKPQYRWLEVIVGRCKPGSAVSYAVLLYTTMCTAICMQLQMYWDNLSSGDWLHLVTYGVLLFIMFGCIVIMVAHQQNTRELQFKVPFVPYIPALSIFFNIELMVHLNAMTWVRFFVWITLGMLVYFLYGIHHSKEGAVGTSYSMLITSNEASKGCWGSTAARSTFERVTKSIGKQTPEDKTPIVVDADES